MKVRMLFAVLCQLFIIIESFAQPVLNSKKIIAGQVYYPDEIDSNIFYYPPGRLKIAEEGGRPDFVLMITRYTGTNLLGDQGKIKFSNILQFKIVMEPKPDSTFQLAKKEMKFKSNPLFLPIPISYIKSKLIYQDINSGDKEIEGNFESTPSPLSNDGYWKERNYTIRLSNEESQLLEHQLTKGITALSFTYEYFSYGSILKNKDQQLVNDTKRANSEIENLKSKKSYEPVNEYSLSSNAFNINVNLTKYPELVKKIDINANRIPADYSAIEVRCYSFNNSLRPDLDARKVDIEATGVAKGSVIKQSAIFSESNKDIVVHFVKFPFAVRTDYKYRYRITDIYKSGRPPASSNWKEAKDWNFVLDITN